MRLRPAVLLVLVITAVRVALPARSFAQAPSAQRTRLGQPSPALFPRYPGLEVQIAFWKRVFAELSEDQVIVHDAADLGRIYSVLDFRDLRARGIDETRLRKIEQLDTDLEKERIRVLLLRLHGLTSRPASLGPEARRLFELFAGVKEPDRFLRAAEQGRVRSQRGLRERFARGLAVARGYFPEMERIFRRHGLPVELTRLPLVESCFDLQAHSRAGAAGIWQFMPRTGRLFLRVDRLVDERRDPLRSSEAAAKFLAQLYERFGSWPLAITAYNHGPEGTARAVRAVGSTDLGEIIRHYHGPAFGFASRNFYAEFLAALEVEREARQYFGELPVVRPPRAEEVVVEHPVRLFAAARCAGTSVERLAELNPALGAAVRRGRRRIPRGYRLRVPSGSARKFRARLAQLAAQRRVTRVARARTRGHRRRVARHRRRRRRRVVIHRVRRGQTLSHIARLYGTTVRALRARNALSRGQILRVGQLLEIPPG